MVKRKDFRPNNSSYSISDKDRETIRNNKKKTNYFSKEKGGVTYGNPELEYGTKKESKEHPSLSKKQSEQVAKDHLKENPEYYDNPSHEGVRYIIEGKKWRDNINGNTYHSVIIVDTKTGEEIYHSPMTYGYGDQYRHTAIDYLIKTGRMKEDDRFNHETNRKRLYFTEQEVKKRDL